MYKSILLVVAIIFLSSYSSDVPNQNEKVIQAAQKGLTAYLNMIPSGMEDRYGFSAGDNLTKCTVGKPYRVITPAKIFYNSQVIPNSNTSPLVMVTNEWRVPV